MRKCEWWWCVLFLRETTHLLEPSLFIHTHHIFHPCLPTSYRASSSQDSDLNLYAYLYAQTLPLNLPRVDTLATSLERRLDYVIKYLKTGRSSQICTGLKTQWLQVVECRVQPCYDYCYGDGLTANSSDNDNKESVIQRKGKGYKKWRADRAVFLMEAVKGCQEGSNLSQARILLSACAKEIERSLTDGYGDILSMLLTVADAVIEWAQEEPSWGEALNNFFDDLPVATNSVNGLKLKVWREDRERVIFVGMHETDTEDTTSDVRFTPGVMLRQVSKINDDIFTPIPNGDPTSKQQLQFQRQGEPRIDEKAMPCSIEGVPLDWRVKLAKALGHRATKVGFNLYRGHYDPLKISPTYTESIVTLKLDALRIKMTTEGRSVSLEVTSNCGFNIPGVKIRMTVTSKTPTGLTLKSFDHGETVLYDVHNIAHDRKYTLKHYGTALDISVSLAVFPDVCDGSEGLEQHCRVLEVPFFQGLRPCNLTDWCVRGDGEGFKSIWDDLQFRVRFAVSRKRPAERRKSENWDILDYAKVHLTGHGLGEEEDLNPAAQKSFIYMDTCGWAFNTVLNSRLFVVLVKTVSAAFLEFRCNRSDTMSFFWATEKDQDAFARWVTKGEFAKESFGVVVEDDTFLSDVSGVKANRLCSF